MTSNEYQYNNTHNVPKVKSLSQEEKNRYENKEYILKNLYLGQEITNIYNDITKENDYIFNYILFPVFNKDYFYSPNYDYYFTTLINDINRINTDILSKSYINSIETEGEMLNYIFLAYAEMWGYCYYYQIYSEKDYRFYQLLEVLDRVYHHEIEIFNLLFDSLMKFHEEDKILKLYERLLSYKITPNSSIYTMVGKIIDKQKKTNQNKEVSDKNKNYNDIEKLLMSSSFSSKNQLDLSLQRRTFRDETEKKILGDLVLFNTSQLCPECIKIIDIEALSMDYKNMRKDSLWAKCPLCNKYILPQFSVKLGNSLNSEDEDNCVKITRFILHSPYELKVKIKETIDKDGCQFLEVEKFKMKYPSLFWSCIWYFKLNKIDYEMMLPYEANIFKSKTNNFNNFINYNIDSNVIKNKVPIKIEKLDLIKNYKINVKYQNNIIIQNIFSFFYINNKFHKYYHTNFKDTNIDKDPKLRRKTYFDFTIVNKYKSLNEDLVDDETEFEEQLKRFTTNK